MDCYIICSLTSAYRQLYNADNYVKWRLGSVPLVSLLKRFDCTYLITLTTVLTIEEYKDMFKTFCHFARCIALVLEYVILQLRAQCPGL